MWSCHQTVYCYCIVTCDNAVQFRHTRAIPDLNKCHPFDTVPITPQLITRLITNHKLYAKPESTTFVEISVHLFHSASGYKFLVRASQVKLGSGYPWSCDNKYTIAQIYGKASSNNPLCSAYRGSRMRRSVDACKLLRHTLQMCLILKTLRT